MLLLKDPYLDLINQYIETDRCMIIPFSTEGIVDMGELRREFCKVNKNQWISVVIPDDEEELEFVKNRIIAMGNAELFENFILHKDSGEFIGAIAINEAQDDSANIVLWIRESEEGEGYGAEVYEAMLNWVRVNTTYSYLRHSIHMQNESIGKIVLQYGGILQKHKTEHGHLMFHIPL